MFNNQSNNAGKTIVSKLTSDRSGKMSTYVAILLVSVGKDNFEDNAIRSAIKMIDNEFQCCYIVVADTLQRYNIEVEKEISSELAYSVALSNGDDWINRYKSYFDDTFTIPYSILRWDELISDPDFIQREAKFYEHIKSSLSLSQAMKESIDEYGDRLRKHLGDDHYKKILDQHERGCFSYLKEECAAIALLPKKTSSNYLLFPPVIVYPGKATKILIENREILIKEEFGSLMEMHSDFLNWVPYRFNKVSDVQKNTKSELKTDNSSLLDLYKSKINSVKFKEEISYLQKVQFAIGISESQLNFTLNAIGRDRVVEFKQYLLEYLLSDDFDVLSKNRTSFVENAFSTMDLAWLCARQLMLIFSSFDKKYLNKCKANIIRILKKPDLIQNKKSGLLRSEVSDSIVD